VSRLVVYDGPDVRVRAGYYSGHDVRAGYYEGPDVSAGTTAKLTQQTVVCIAENCRKGSPVGINKDKKGNGSKNITTNSQKAPLNLVILDTKDLEFSDSSFKRPRRYARKSH
jgi:hypothetical protein